MNDALAGPRRRDWALLALSLVLVAGGLVMLPSQPGSGISVIVFFGACGIVAALRILRSGREQRVGPALVEVVGGVPIRPSRGRTALLGGSVAALGTVLLVFGGEIGALLQGLGGFIALVGYLVLAGVALGKLPAGYIEFDPEGLSIASSRWVCLVPWDAIARIAPSTYHDNPTLLVWLGQDAEVVVTPHERAGAVRRHLASNQQFIGAPVAITTSLYGIDLPILLQAVERYARDPAARSSLGRRRLS